ncbi:MAG TPA: AraC family transcriptional regulator [Rhizomicrobium sp.]|nr:AraC family transcriptional regulator [Rhizomicrobium sp.]
MTMTTRVLGNGSGWSVEDILCSAGPKDPPFEEQHGWARIAFVIHGTFRYETVDGAADLVPGSVLLGTPRHCFQCGHEHGWGDRCIAFGFAPETLESVAAQLPGVRSAAFGRAALPPLEALMPLAARAAALDGDKAECEALAFEAAETVVSTLGEIVPSEATPRASDRRRVADALKRIEKDFESPLSLSELAAGAGLSEFHFLRVFRALVGMTPHQFLLRTRLHQAALRLRKTADSISAIAFDCGFGDLSTFNHRFRRVMGVNPSRWRDRNGRSAST